MLVVDDDENLKKSSVLKERRYTAVLDILLDALQKY